MIKHYQILTKRLFLAIVATLIFYSCNQESNITADPITNQQPSNKGTARFSEGIFVSVIDLHEFEYKNHTYIGCRVRDGISLTHAGYCKCYKQTTIQD
jgi:hypothetical protein